MKHSPAVQKLHSISLKSAVPYSIDDLESFGDRAFDTVAEAINISIEKATKDLENFRDVYRKEIFRMLERTAQLMERDQFETVGADQSPTYKGQRHGGPGQIPKNYVHQEYAVRNRKELEEKVTEQEKHTAETVRRLQHLLYEVDLLRNETTTRTSSLDNMSSPVIPDATAESASTILTPEHQEDNGVRAYVRKGWESLRRALHMR